MLSVLNLYIYGTNYFWMLCEGIYLHTLIIVAVFVGEQQLGWYYVLGWGEYALLAQNTHPKTLNQVPVRMKNWSSVLWSSELFKS